MRLGSGMRLLSHVVMLLCASSSTLWAQDSSFLLYRNSLIDSSLKIHIASFDTNEGAEYNAENCWLAADLFQNQPGVSTRFWCEPSEDEEQK